MIPKIGKEELSELRKIKSASTNLRLRLGFIAGIIATSCHIILDIAIVGFYESFKLSLFNLSVFILCLCFLFKLENCSERFLIISTLSITEISNLIIGILAIVFYPKCIGIFSQISVLAFIFYNTVLPVSGKTLLFLAAKQTAVWTFYFLVFFDMGNGGIVITIIGPIQLYLFYFFTLYFDYLKDISICKSQMKVKSMHTNIFSIVEAISDYVLVIDKLETIIFANTSAKNLIQNGSAQTYFSKNYYYRKYLSNDSKDIFSEIKNLFACPLNTELNFGIIESNSELYEWSGKLIEWDNQASIILCGRNVTHLVKLEKEYNESQYKSALLRTVSHELRTPVSAVISIAQIIESTEKLSSESKERIEIIKNSCNYQLCLINDLLDYAQILSGTLKISKTFFNINQLLIDCIKIIKIQLQEKDVRLELITNTLPKTIFSDPYRIKQVILNLLSNARKFTIKGMIILEANYDKNIITITCKDTGIGISKEKISSLFIPYGKFECSSQLNPQGVGLGLAISDMLVKELGGEGITVKSELEKGSCFSFSLPTQSLQNTLLVDIPDEDTKIAVPFISIKTILHKNEVLIVDDMYFNVMALSHLLKNEGISCSYALNGEEAIEKIKIKKFSCILMDCEMPILNGWETTKKIRNLYIKGVIASIPPIIACTAHTSEHIKNTCFEAGMDDLIIKPCQTEILITKINQWMFKFRNCDNT
ncbi:hypothetical protein SteCoe_31304 [Stentor coeruleus]|uniref:Histidine kinase n=1 Tax=Stentor coeruleus TaxID=5963 RepID=A0A1R2B212_9CILI|nr:hypothetical protein SteCoe_31304 [Stentor coeruleus]